MELWLLILNCDRKKLQINQCENEFRLFTEVFDEFIDTINEMDIEGVEKRLNFYNFSDLIARISIWIKYDIGVKDKFEYKQHKLESQNEISELYSLARYLGYFLGKNNKNNIINQNVWENVLKNPNLFFQL